MLKSTATGGIWRLFTIAVVVLGVLLGVVFLNMQSTEELAREVERTEDIDRTLRELEANALGGDAAIMSMLLAREDTAPAPFSKTRDAATARLQRLDRLMRHPEARQYRARLETLTREHFDHLQNILTLVRAGRYDDAQTRALANERQRAMDDLRSLLATTIALEQRLLGERRKQLDEHLQGILLSVTVGGAIAIALLFVTALGTAARLKRPITNLLDGLEAMSHGRLDHRVSITTQDEIGRVAQAFNDMAGRLQDAHRAEAAALAELQRSNTELDQFAYVASHDLKAPLRGIRNLADWITEDLGPGVSEDTRENLALLHSRVDRLDSLLEALLDYSRVGRREAAIEAVDVAQLVDDIAEYVAPPPGFSITRTDLPTVQAPRPPLETVLRNLINNAIKHHDRLEGTITVSARDLGDAIEFRVADDGPGIPTQFHDRVFQMFQTLKPRDKVEGSGMGLAIVRKTIEHYGGRIDIESDPSSRGTTFVFTWPRQVSRTEARAT